MDSTYLGFDYGTTNIAMALMDNDGYEDFTRTYFKKLNTKSKPNEMHEDIKYFLSSETGVFEDESVFSPHVAYIESVFKGPNVKTFQGMTRVAHSLYILLSGWGIECHYIDNNTWRKVLFGKGNIKKEECQEWAYKEWPFLLEYKKSERGHRADAFMICEAGKRLKENNEREILRPEKGQGN